MSTEAATKIRISGNTLTKEEQKELLESILPACQPQEGSPCNTFTASELDDLKRALPSIQIGPRGAAAKRDDDPNQHNNNNTINICNLKQWEAPQTTTQLNECSAAAPPQDGCEDAGCDVDSTEEKPDALDWYGGPRFHPDANLSREFRMKVRRGEFTTPTNGVCPGFLQCNLVVLPQGQIAFDFLLFCQRNPKACPLIDVCDVGSPFAPGVAPGADLRTDVPK